MKSIMYVYLILVGLTTGNHHNDISLPASEVNSSLTEFSLNLFKELSNEKGNVLFSPLSIAVSLSSLSLGARSTTRTQILEGLSFNVSEIEEKEIHKAFHDHTFKLSHASDQVQVDLGQALFLRENVTFKQTFLDDVRSFYEAEITSAKFQKPKEAEKQINDYVEKKTHGKITQLVTDLDPATVLVAVNYIYFQGNWKTPFNPNRTTERYFFVDEKTAIQVPMMFQEGWFDFYFDEERSCTVLRLEYNDSVSAYFVLPERGKGKQLVEALSLDTVTEWQTRVQCGVAHVYLPKFEVSTIHSLKKPLRNLHITDVFSNSADLSGITEEIPLKLSEVTHKAVLSIDEKGTTASAATALEAVPMSLPPTIKFNRPFLSLITFSENDVPLFLGKIINPRGQ